MFSLQPSIDTRFPTLLLLGTRLTYRHLDVVLDPATNTSTTQVVTNYTQGHYEVVRTFYTGQPNATAPDPDSAVYRTELRNYEVQQAYENTVQRTTGAGGVARRSDTSIDALRGAPSTVPIGRMGRPILKNPLESSMFSTALLCVQ